MTDPTPVPAPTPDPVTTTTTTTAVVLPPGPDLDALDAFAAALPDDGHRQIAQQLAAAVRAHDTQIQALAGTPPVP